MNARTLLLPLVALLLLTLHRPALGTQEVETKSDLRVLLVSHDPENPRITFADMANERTRELYRERAGAFEALLKEHFQDVRLVYGPDYELAMSDAVDVTLFDARPPELAAAVRDTDPETGAMTYRPASYLPESFDRPALLIAENSPLIGEAIGLKLDWL